MRAFSASVSMACKSMDMVAHVASVLFMKNSTLKCGAVGDGAKWDRSLEAESPEDRGPKVFCRGLEELAFGSALCAKPGLTRIA